jgi:diguanylate cyclase (GGDEF)-like protein
VKIGSAPSKPPAVLVADDSVVPRVVLWQLLEKAGYPVVAVADGKAALAALEAGGGPRLAILDWNMPGLDGVEVCRRLRAAQRDCYTYVMLLTARDHRDDLLSALEAGVDDYVSKPFDRSELLARLALGRRLVDLQTQLAATRDRLHEEATRDGLTGLLNRRAAEEALRRELARAERARQPVAVALADLDRFKKVNDEHGHAAGDAVLRVVAERLQGALRQGDLLARWGGEELLVILPGAGPEVAAEATERLRAAVAAAPVTTPEGKVMVTASFGYAVSHEHSRPDFDILLSTADQRLYRAKAAGRNRVEGPPSDRLLRRRPLELVSATVQ